MSEIKFKLVDGEPVCDEAECLVGTSNAISIPPDCVRDDGEVCIPGLRQQRDEAREELDLLRRVPTLGMVEWLKYQPAVCNSLIDEMAVYLKGKAP